MCSWCVFVWQCSISRAFVLPNPDQTGMLKGSRRVGETALELRFDHERSSFEPAQNLLLLLNGEIVHVAHKHKLPIVVLGELKKKLSSRTAVGALDHEIVHH